MDTVSKFGNLGCCYEVVGGTTIQKQTGRHSTKQDMHLQQLMSTRSQNILSKNLKQKMQKTFALVFMQLWFPNLVIWKSLSC